jgi:FtsH-binding integral membrane protein
MLARSALAVLGIALTVIAGALALGTLLDPLENARFAVVFVLTLAVLVFPISLGVRMQPQAPRVYW